MNMTVYYIYEIPGVKVGCTKNLKHRVEYKQKCPLGSYKVLGAANNPQDAADMEREWQIKLGYKVDGYDYNKMLEIQSKSNTPEALAKMVANTDYQNRNIDYSKIDWKVRDNKRIANTNFKKKAANTDYSFHQNPEFIAKRVEKNKKSIFSIDNDGNTQEFDSIKEASIKLGIGEGAICNCLKGRQKTTKGFIFKYK